MNSTYHKQTFISVDEANEPGHSIALAVFVYWDYLYILAIWIELLNNKWINKNNQYQWYFKKGSGSKGVSSFFYRYCWRKVLKYVIQLFISQFMQFFNCSIIDCIKLTISEKWPSHLLVNWSYILMIESFRFTNTQQIHRA